VVVDSGQRGARRACPWDAATTQDDRGTTAGRPQTAAKGGGDVAKDLGTWPPEQATVLVQVLQRANLTPDAKRTKAGILVTVPDDQADVAVRALADNMDAIADAARSRTEARRRRARESRPGTGGTTPDGRLPTERLVGAARPIAILLIALLTLSVVARISPLLALIGVGVGVYLLGKRAQDGDGPGGMGGMGGPGWRGPPR